MKSELIGMVRIGAAGHRSGQPRTASSSIRLKDEANLAARRKKLLAEMAAELLAGEDPDTVVMPKLFEALAAERVVDGTLGFIVTEMGAGMKLGFMEGFDREMVQRCLTLDFGQAICGTVAATGRAMHVTDIQRTLDPIADLVRSAGVNAYACEPLVARGRLLGTISFASRSRRRFEPGDLVFFRAVAAHLARARDRAERRKRKLVAVSGRSTRALIASESTT